MPCHESLHSGLISPRTLNNNNNMIAPLPLFLLILLHSAASAAPLPITSHDVQPHPRDTVHTVWIHGPTHSGKLGGGTWPQFGTGGSSSDSRCTTKDDRWTGYTTSGQYCEKASAALDDKAHLLIHSGRLGLVIDAGGLKASAASSTRNLIPKLGPVATTAGPRQVYDTLPAHTTSITLQTASCGSASDDATYVLGAKDNSFVQMGLVRQGHAVTQVSLTGLEFHETTSGALLGPCAGFTAVQQPGGPNCNGFPGSWPCSNALYPDCVGFVQGSSWGKCHSQCTAGGHTELWGELSLWADAVVFELAWASPFSLPAGCSGTINMTLGGVSNTAVLSGSGGGRLSVVLSPSVPPAAPGLVLAPTPVAPVVITSASGRVVSRTTTARDYIIEVPKTMAKCGYDTNCAATPMTLVDMVATNPSSSVTQTVRLSFSRGFETRSTELASNRQSTPSAEITGFNVQLWDTASQQPTGIPVQISKNWHSGSTAAYWAGFDGMWWTASALLRLPPNASVSLSLAVNYEKYAGIPAWSHAQLSLVGYSDQWLWEEAALGTGGENFCMDPLGSHTRATITDVRVKLFDGKWKENVGGADFMQLFDSDGKLLYLTELDSQIHVSGPALSDATYVGKTLGGGISSHVRVRGARTDDLVRVFLDISLRVLVATPFARFFYFQLGSETYSYHPAFSRFVWGSASAGAGAGAGAGAAATTLSRTCDGKAGGNQSPRRSSKLYDSPGPVRQALSGSAPWYFAMEDNTDDATLAGDNGKVVGDRGLVVRRFAARLGGAAQTSPTFSVLCDKIELGTPAGLSALQAGDFVNVSLELLVLPRGNVDAEYALAQTRTQSKTLQRLAGMTTAARVLAQAQGGELRVSSVRGGRVASHYPIRVVASAAGVGIGAQQQLVMFTVNASSSGTNGSAAAGLPLGFVPVVVAGLRRVHLPTGHGLWTKPAQATSWTRLVQGSSSGAHWQANYDVASSTYALVFNVEFLDASTDVALGPDPSTWPATEVDAGGAGGGRTTTTAAAPPVSSDTSTSVGPAEPAPAPFTVTDGAWRGRRGPSAGVLVGLWLVVGVLCLPVGGG